mmetsp:Transcript_18757/g.27147  ORF Transcript_18757/g.27147 Transcript_18757/m.27147 type:complete len:180 (-) Transcript_18757:410-949(-)
MMNSGRFGSDKSLSVDDNAENKKNEQLNLHPESVHPDSEQVEGAIPIEEQLHEVDMEDPNMDPLEWSVRKVIPVPKAYFWETGNENLPTRTKMWHRTVGVLEKSARGLEKAGEFVANTFGFNASEYDYVTSTMTKEQWEASKARAREQRRKSMAYLEQKEKEKKEEVVAADIGVTKDAL